MTRKSMPPDAKPVLAVVGGIGSGKSLVARELARHGGHLIVADELGHEALRQPDIVARIVEHWGPEVLDEQGNIVRRKLGAIVFERPEELKTLQSFVYPYIGRRLEEEKSKAGLADGVRFIVVDAAVILEAGWTNGIDRLIFVEAPRDVRLLRVQGRGWDEKELLKREANQMHLEEKKRLADVVLVNDNGLEKVSEQVERLLRSWCLTT